LKSMPYCFAGAAAPQRNVKMIARQSLAKILAAADKADEEDAAIRAALHVALRGIREFAALSRNSH
jgi:hypothetical protein